MHTRACTHRQTTQKHNAYADTNQWQKHKNMKHKHYKYQLKYTYDILFDSRIQTAHAIYMKINNFSQVELPAILDSTYSKQHKQNQLFVCDTRDLQS